MRRHLVIPVDLVFWGRSRLRCWGFSQRGWSWTCYGVALKIIYKKVMTDNKCVLIDSQWNDDKVNVLMKLILKMILVKNIG
jgi:hypothetical protein